MPGHYGNGRMACLAKELTRQSLWDAFAARRVYGVTGDRILLDFRLNDAVMGSVINVAGTRRIHIKVTGSDALDRIEILRNNRVIDTYCHQGKWDVPKPGQTSRFKLRVEAGWGPRPYELSVPRRLWDGELRVHGGRMLGSEPCWISGGQKQPTLNCEKASFELVSKFSANPPRVQNANIFEFEANPDALLTLRLNGLEETGAVSEFASGSRLMSYGEECVQMLGKYAGIEPRSPERGDVYHNLAYKAKMHRAIPEAGYTAEHVFEDDTPLEGETHYRVRVEQRNGQRAWSSPIWVTPR